MKSINYLCGFITDNINIDINDTIHYSCFSYDEFYDFDDCINIISNYLKIDKNEINFNIDNLYLQRKALYSCKYKNRICEFYEHYDSQRDYICVRLLPILE